MIHACTKLLAQIKKTNWNCEGENSMLSQEFVFVVLQASLTGAGLVLAIYALITPIANRLFKSRAEALAKVTKEIKKTSEEIDTKDTKDTKKKIARLTTLTEELSSKISFPTYLSLGILLTFVGYIASTLMCIQWLVNPSAPITETIDHWLPAVFAASTIIFLLVGVTTITDTYRLLKKEFEKTKEEIEKAKSIADISVDRSSF